VRASAITAIPMPEAEMQALSELLSKRFQANFEIENRVDPDILGGVVLQIDGKVLDGSIRNQLRRLRAQMLFERN
jgi:F-type H+-transporting ATPase subunit delta